MSHFFFFACGGRCGSQGVVCLWTLREGTGKNNSVNLCSGSGRTARGRGGSGRMNPRRNGSGSATRASASCGPIEGSPPATSLAGRARLPCGVRLATSTTLRRRTRRRCATSTASSRSLPSSGASATCHRSGHSSSRRAMLTHGMRPGAPVHVHPPPACCTFQRRRAACPSLQARRRTVLRPCSGRAAWWPAGAAFVRGRQLRPGGLRWVPAGDPQPRARPRRRPAQGALRQVRLRSGQG